MNNLKVGDYEYKKLARQYAWLLWVKSRRELTEYEAASLELVNKAMSAAELAHVGSAKPEPHTEAIEDDWETALRYAGG